MKIGSLFTGYGGLDMAVGEFFGAETVWVCEFDKAASKVIADNYPNVPNIGDITKVDWGSVEPVDILTGGFPCQDLSVAGGRAGLRDGTRSGLWSEFAKSIDVLRPRLVVIENVRGILSASAHSDMEPCAWCLGDGSSEPTLRALGAVLGDLAAIGYDAEWCGVRAADAGATHNRMRVFIVAYPVGERPVGGVSAHWGEDEDQPLVRGQLLPTPTVQDGSNNASPSQFRRKTLPLNTQVFAPGWGKYAESIELWGNILGRSAPPPTMVSDDGVARLSSLFVEWMMGLPEGWVTGHGLSRNDELKMLGNGVVPQQAFLALSLLFGQGTPGQSTPGQGEAGQGGAGQGRAGQGRAGRGRTGQ